MNINDYAKVNKNAKVRHGKQLCKPGTTRPPIMPKDAPLPAWSVGKDDEITYTMLRLQGFIA